MDKTAADASMYTFNFQMLNDKAKDTILYVCYGQLSRNLKFS